MLILLQRLKGLVIELILTVDNNISSPNWELLRENRRKATNLGAIYDLDFQHTYRCCFCSSSWHFKSY